jgi:hypothetical protein
VIYQILPGLETISLNGINQSELPLYLKTKAQLPKLSSTGNPFQSQNILTGTQNSSNILLRAATTETDFHSNR